MNNSHQSRLAALLKRKGIGPAGSKSLKQEELEELLALFPHEQVSLTTKASMLTALLLLPPTEVEETYVDRLKKDPQRYLPKDLLPFIEGESDAPFLDLILKNIQKQDLSAVECLSLIHI